MMQCRRTRMRVAAILVTTMSFAASARAATITLDADGLQDVDNLQQIALALHNYHDVLGEFPADYVDSGGTALLSWRVALLPFLGQQSLFDRFDLTRAWNDPDNLPLLQLMPDVYRSPASATASTDTDYAGGSGPNTMFDGSSGVTLGSVTDGTSNTLMVGEALGSSIPWTMPGDVLIDSCPTLQGSGFSSFIPGAVPFAFVDGSVRFLPDDIDCATLRSLFLRNDGIADTSSVLDHVAAPVPEPAMLALLGGGAVLVSLRRLRLWAMAWRPEAAAWLMTQYRQAMADTDLLPNDPESWRAFLRASWIERAAYQVTVELEERRGWLAVPLRELIEMSLDS